MDRLQRQVAFLVVLVVVLPDHHGSLGSEAQPFELVDELAEGEALFEHRRNVQVRRDMWVRLDDAYYDHTKVVHAGPLAELLWVRALAWCNRNRTRSTDGVVPTDIVWRLASFCGRLSIDGDSVSPSDLARALVREGLWVEVHGGYAIHDYTEYQRTLDELEDLSAKRSAAGRKGAESRWGGNTDSNTMANAKAGERQPTSPTDAPSPEPPGFPSSVVVDEPGTSPQVPDDVWTEYARLKRPADVRNITAYDTKTVRNAKTEHGATAARWWSLFDITPSELAAALVDGAPSRSWIRRSPEEVNHV